MISYKYFFIPLLVSLVVGSVTAEGAQDYPVDEFPFFAECEFHTAALQCQHPVSLELYCNGVFLCCPDDDVVGNYICDGEKFVNTNQRDKEYLEDIDVGQLVFTIDDIPFEGNESASVARFPSFTGTIVATTTILLSSYFS